MARTYPWKICNRLYAGYDYLVMRLLLRAYRYLDHIRSRGEEKPGKFAFLHSGLLI